MKANKKSLMRGDESAQAGIGTLIIFIAMVLVAAVAAAVLIQTSGVLQEKAQSTGKQASEEVSSNLMIKSIEAVRSDDGSSESDTLDLLKLKVALNIGSSDVDLNQVVITITDGDTTNDLVYANNDKTHGDKMSGFDSSNASANLEKLLTATGGPGDYGKYFFTVEKVRDEDGSFSQSSPVMNAGDLVTVYVSTVSSGAAGTYDNVDDLSNITLLDTGLSITSRTDVILTLTPEMGGATTASFTAPATFNQKTIPLWP